MNAGRPKGRNPMVNMRIDPVLFEYLTRAAKANNRTMAAEAAFRLTKSMVEEELRARLAPPKTEDAA